MTEQDRGRRGVVYGLAAYGLWGAVPLFWPLVKRAGAIELLAHRVIWSLVISLLLIIFVVPKGWWGRIATRRNLILLGVAAATVSVNWGTYIWAVNHGHVVDTSLGYYINPILSILVGVIALHERMSRRAVAQRRSGRGRGRGADHRLRPAAVDRPGAGDELRHLRRDEEDGQRRRGGDADHRVGDPDPDRPGLPDLPAGREAS